MSGIAGLILPTSGPSRAGLVREELDAMANALQGRDAGPPLLLDQGRVVLMARGGVGYETGLRTRPLGEGAEAALAVHGSLPKSTQPLEALLDTLIERGPESIESLRGEFAIAFWDGRDRTLHLATDRLRIQSLLFSDRPDQFLFASRMNALLASPVPFRPGIDAASMLDVVASSIVATPRTIFANVAKLPPGHRLTIRGGKVTSAPYWDIDFTHADGASPERLEAVTREALDAAVGDRLARDDAGEAHADRFGAFLSGGIDSSTVLGILTKRRGRPVRSFSIGFGDERFNELHYARVAAAAFGSAHTEYFVTPRDTADAIDAVAEAFDEPFANASAIPTYYCAKVAREQGIDVLYAGDGGDELFAGNERYASGRVFEHYNRIPAWIRAPLLTPAIAAAGALVPLPLFSKARKYVLRASLSPAERIASYGFWNVIPPAAFVRPELLEAAGDYHPAAAVLRHYDQARARTSLDRQLYLDLKITISDNDVLKVTRMCERAGVAVRFPFLDERVVEAAMLVPAHLKMRGGELRTFFKNTYRDLLPLEIRNKTKHGFGLPISGWLRTDPELHAIMRDLVLSERTVGRGYWKRAALEDLVRRHAEDPTPYYGTVLWNLMVLELWHRRVLDARPAA